MLAGIIGFEIRYQLRNPVFWVSIAIFFLLGFGLTASENVSIGTPGTVHENAPFAIAVATAAFVQFYLFVTTAFVAASPTADELLPDCTPCRQPAIAISTPYTVPLMTPPTACVRPTASAVCRRYETGDRPSMVTPTKAPPRIPIASP